MGLVRNYHHSSHHNDHIGADHQRFGRMVSIYQLIPKHRYQSQKLTEYCRFTTRPCSQIAFVLGQDGTVVDYPQCSQYFDGSDPTKRVIVTADFASNNPVEIAASLAVPFGTAGWLALLLHTIAIELYVSSDHYFFRRNRNMLTP